MAKGWTRSPRASGHDGPEFSTTLPEADKLALMEYLKVLPPQPEYSW